MPHYRCVVSDKSGKKTEIIKDASNEKELVISIKKMDLYLIASKKIEDSRLTKTKRRYSKDTILDFTEIMAALLKAGLTIQDGLGLCRSIAGNKKTAALCQSLLDGLQRGAPFHETLKTNSSSFSSLYQSLIRLGEKTGSVAGVFSRMGSYLRSEKQIKRKVGNALWYPAFILCIAIAGCFGIVFYIMPQMAEIFSAFNVGNEDALSLELRQVYVSLWALLIMSCVLLVSFVCFIILRKTSERFVLLSDTLFLKMPLAGRLIKSIQTMDFAFAMEMLTGSGITVSSALKETASVVSNRAFSRAILEVNERLERGEKLSAAFMGHAIFPDYISVWLTVGERTGAVEQIFTQIRSYFQNDVDHGSERLMEVIQPALTLLVGVIIIALVIQFVLPIFSLYGRIM
jgi:type II secretory pathway component PulF